MSDRSAALKVGNLLTISGAADLIKGSRLPVSRVRITLDPDAESGGSDLRPGKAFLAPSAENKMVSRSAEALKC